MNLVSLVAGLLLYGFFEDIARTVSFDNRAYLLLGLFFILTLIVEFFVIRLVCKSYQVKPLIKVIVAGNVITYSLLTLFLYILR